MPYFRSFHVLDQTFYKVEVPMTHDNSFVRDLDKVPVDCLCISFEVVVMNAYVAWVMKECKYCIDTHKIKMQSFIVLYSLAFLYGNGDPF